MGDASERSVAEKLAAAKKKHKAYLKEKGLKSGKKNGKEDAIENAADNSNNKLPNENFVNENVNQYDSTNQIYTQTAYPNFTYEDPVAFFDTFTNNPSIGNKNESSISNFFSQNNVIDYEDNKNFQVGVEKINENNEISADINYAQNGAYMIPNFENNVEVKLPSESLANFSLGFSNDESNVKTLSEDEILKQNIEKQNAELLAIIDQQNLKSVEMHSTLENTNLKYQELQKEYDLMKLSQVNPLTTSNEPSEEISKLKDELKCHIQTINLLVNEKSELTNTVTELQTQLNHQSKECVELNEKFQNAHRSIFALQKELETLKTEKQHFISMQKELENNYKTVLNQYQDLRENRDDINQELMELKSKVKLNEETIGNYQKSDVELKNQLNLANIKIQQLSINDETTRTSELEKMLKEKQAFEKELANANEMIRLLTQEKLDASVHYQRFAQQLSEQVAHLSAKVEQYQKENDKLKANEDSRIRHIGDLEKQLQNMSDGGIAYSAQRNNLELRKELEKIKAQLKTVEDAKDATQETYTKVANENMIMQKELSLSKDSVEKLEQLVEQLKGAQPDSAVLLATMESDKVAASKAISQNNELKKQMECMQEVMVKVNNSNVELTENLTTEQKTNRELMEKLQKTEISLQTLVEAIEVKDKELIALRNQLENFQKNMLQNEELRDRLRHYEVVDHSSPSLQNELEQSKRVIKELENRLDSLKREQQEKILQESNTIQEFDNAETVESLNLDELKQAFTRLKTRNSELESMVANLNQHVTDNDSNGNENLNKETAMKHLEQKVVNTMEIIAKLTEEKQRLEHLVLQLQGETETIGEYVALYQHQRSVLKQKALEKDQELQRLTNDRENIKSKLERLNNLVGKLMSEKGAITEELLMQHQQFVQERDDLCAEHAKIHNQINKLAVDKIDDTRNENGDANTEIAEEIITLLSEIKNSNLVQPHDKIHHCAWCSGQLVTV